MANGREASGAGSSDLPEIHAEGADQFEKINTTRPQPTTAQSSRGSGINVVIPDPSEINRLNVAVTRDNNHNINHSMSRQYINSQYSHSTKHVGNF